MGGVVAGVLLSLKLLALASGQSMSLGPLAKPDSLTERAPEIYKARFETSKGPFVIEVRREWAPIGADRFYNLVKHGFYDDCRFFRVIDGRLAQAGINGNPAIQSAWANALVADEPARQSNKPGYVSLAHAGRDTRATQFFINIGDNGSSLDVKGFAPIGRVVSGMDAVEKLYSGYGDGAPRGIGPSQTRIASEGNTFLKKEFPKLDFVKKASIEK